jgi:RNA polymerase sigma-70 factor (ECF subfamily)
MQWSLATAAAPAGAWSTWEEAAMAQGVGDEAPPAGGPPADRERPGDPGADEALAVERARAGDRKAFRWLVERHEGRVFQLARRQLRDDEAARDVAQDVFIKAYRNLDRFEGRSRFSTWLYRLTMNQCHDWRRRELARPSGHAGDAGTDTVEALVASDPHGDPVRAGERADLRRGLARAIEALPEDMRTTLVLREVDDLPYAEIARIQDIPKGTVMSRLHNARRRLRRELEALGFGPTAAGGDREEETP